MLRKAAPNWTELEQPAARPRICGRSGIGTHQGVTTVAKVKTGPSGEAGVASPKAEAAAGAAHRETCFGWR